MHSASENNPGLYNTLFIAFNYKNCNVHMNNIRIEHVAWYINTI